MKREYIKKKIPHETTERKKKKKTKPDCYSCGKEERNKTPVFSRNIKRIYCY